MYSKENIKSTASCNFINSSISYKRNPAVMKVDTRSVLQSPVNHLCRTSSCIVDAIRLQHRVSAPSADIPVVAPVSSPACTADDDCTDENSADYSNYDEDDGGVP